METSILAFFERWKRWISWGLPVIGLASGLAVSVSTNELLGGALVAVSFFALDFFILSWAHAGRARKAVARAESADELRRSADSTIDHITRRIKEGLSLEVTRTMYYEITPEGDTTLTRIDKVRLLPDSVPLLFWRFVVSGDCLDRSHRDSITFDVRNATPGYGGTLNRHVRWKAPSDQMAEAHVWVFHTAQIEPGDTIVLELICKWPKQNPQLGADKRLSVSMGPFEHGAQSLKFEIRLDPSFGYVRRLGYDGGLQNGPPTQGLGAGLKAGWWVISAVEPPFSSEDRRELKLTPPE